MFLCSWVLGGGAAVGVEAFEILALFHEDVIVFCQQLDHVRPEKGLRIVAFQDGRSDVAVEQFAPMTIVQQHVLEVQRQPGRKYFMAVAGDMRTFLPSWAQ